MTEAWKRIATLWARPRWRRPGRAAGERVFAIALVAPAVLVVGGVYLYPAAVTLIYSVSKIDIANLALGQFVGFQNFRTVVEDDAFWPVMLRTLYFGAILAGVTTLLSLPIALLLNRPFRGRTLVRVVVLLPWAVPPVVSGVLWGQMFNAEFGFINGFIRELGGSGSIVWLGDPTLALHAILVAEIWRWLPFATLFMLAGIQTVPRSVLEASALDGAGPLQTLRHITLPLMLGVIVPVAIFLFVAAMKTFDTIFVLTRGGPRQGTTTLNYLVFQQGFEQFRFGQAAATAYILTLATLLAIAVLGYVRLRVVARTGG